MSLLKIEAFKPDDFDGVSNLWRECLPAKDPWNETKSTVWRQQCQQPHGFFVGRVANTIVATCIAGYDGIRGWLYRLAVSPSHRGHGFGRQIVEHAEQYLSRLGCPKVNLQVRSGNEAAVQFYESIGYFQQNHFSMAKLLHVESLAGAAVATACLTVDENTQLTSFVNKDKSSLCRMLNESMAYSQNTSMPYPYTEANAEAWLAKLASSPPETDRVWAIRQRDGSLLGAIGFHGIRRDHSTSLGYWLAMSHWNRGVTTKVVGRLCDFAFQELNLIRITAEVFRDNDASARVLEKNGFRQEGLMRAAHRQADGFTDVRLFARLRPDFD